ncbi:DUF6879 family protein [Streptomyces sp. NPDC054784]
MQLISSAERNRLFESFAYDAFHLELRDEYGSPVEDTPYARWRSGDADDLGWLESWLSLMKRVTGQGKSVRRVRVVTEPHSPYIEWEHSLTHLNTAAGEDIRWLPRHLLPWGTTFPVGGNDWWLYDDRLLAVGHVDSEGRTLGSEIIDDVEVVAACRHIRDVLWETAVPHDAYKF